jgi:hypothetical protein
VHLISLGLDHARHASVDHGHSFTHRRSAHGNPRPIENECWFFEVRHNSNPAWIIGPPSFAVVGGTARVLGTGQRIPLLRASAFV